MFECRIFSRRLLFLLSTRSSDRQRHHSLAVGFSPMECYFGLVELCKGGVVELFSIVVFFFPTDHWNPYFTARRDFLSFAGRFVFDIYGVYGLDKFLMKQFNYPARPRIKQNAEWSHRWIGPFRLLLPARRTIDARCCCSVASPRTLSRTKYHGLLRIKALDRSLSSLF